MWKKNEAGRWTYRPGADRTHRNLGGRLAEQATMPVAEKDGAAVLYIPVQTLDDGYREHRLFKHLDPSPVLNGFWIEAWQDPDEAMTAAFPNLATVDLATSSDVVRLDKFTRAPSGYLPVNPSDHDALLPVGRALRVDGAIVLPGQRVLVKDQWKETLQTYAFTRPLGNRSVRIASNAMEFLTEDNAVKFYDAAGNVVHVDRVHDLSFSGGHTDFTTFGYVPPTAAAVADDVDGDWQRVTYYGSNGVYRYEVTGASGELVEEPDLATQDSCYHYTVWATSGASNTNAQYFLERLGAAACAAALDEDEEPDNNPAWGIYPAPGEDRVFSPGYAHVVAHQMTYNVAPVPDPDGAYTVEQPPVRLMTLDHNLARKSGYKPTYAPAAVTEETKDSTELLLEDSGQPTIMRQRLAERFVVQRKQAGGSVTQSTETPVTAFRLVGDADDRQMDGDGEMFYGNDRFQASAAFYAALAVGDLVHIEATDTLDFSETFCVQQKLASNRVRLHPPLSTALLQELLPAAIAVRCVNGYTDWDDFAQGFNASMLGQYYRIAEDSVIALPQPEGAYHRMDITLAGDEGDEIVLAAASRVLELDGPGVFDPVYTDGYTLYNAALNTAPEEDLEEYESTSLPDVSYEYLNDEESTARFGIEFNRIVFGADYDTPYETDPASARLFEAGMKLRLDSTAGTQDVVVGRVYKQTAVRGGVPYEETVLELRDGVTDETTIPGPGVTVTVSFLYGESGLGSFQSLSDFLEENTGQDRSDLRSLAQVGYAHAMARDKFHGTFASSILATDQDRRLRVLVRLPRPNPPDGSTELGPDPRLVFEPIDARRVGVEHKYAAGVMVDAGSDSILLGDLLVITPQHAQSRRIRFIDGLDEGKILGNLEGQGKYGWILDSTVVAVGAVVGCTGGNGTGDLVWYAGDWRGGTWEDGVWLSGTWRGGHWKQGTWKSVQVLVTPSTVTVNNANQKNEFSTWRNGVWDAGVWNGGTWRAGTWNGGLWSYGVWEKGTWRNGTFSGGVWTSGTWLNGNWTGGDFERGTWLNGYWSQGVVYQSRFGTNAVVDSVTPSNLSTRAVWHGGVWNGGEWHTGPGNDDHRAALWLSGEWNGGDWLGGTFVYGTWTDGAFRAGFWLGGYPLHINGSEVLTNPDATPVDNPSTPALKHLTVEVGQYDSLLSFTNEGHRVRPGAECWFLGVPVLGGEDADWLQVSDFIANGLYSDSYVPKVATSAGDDTLAVTVSPRPLAALVWQQSGDEDVPDGTPRLASVWRGGEWHNGFWLHGVWTGGVWYGGIWSDGLFAGGVFGETTHV